jgi:hypothetical protein
MRSSVNRALRPTDQDIPQTYPADQPRVEQPDQPREEPVRRARARRGGSGYRRVMRGIGLVFVAGLMGLLWFLGAMFTVRYVNSINVFGYSLSAWGNYTYALPIGITVAEFAFAPWREQDNRWRLVWGLILVFDALTTAFGFHALTAERVIEPFTIALPVIGTVGPIGLAVGSILALVPEPVFRGAISDLWGEIAR